MIGLGGVDADAQQTGELARQSCHPALFPVGSHGKHLIGDLLDDSRPIRADDGENQRRAHGENVISAIHAPHVPCLVVVRLELCGGRLTHHLCLAFVARIRRVLGHETSPHGVDPDRHQRGIDLAQCAALAAVPRHDGRRWRRSSGSCPIPGARRRTSRGLRMSRASAGARPSSGATTCCSPPSSTPVSRSLPSRASISATGRPRRRRTAGWSTTSTSTPARCDGTQEVGSTPPAKAKHLKNSYASETPVTDGERVYVYFGNLGLFALDLNGKPVWSKPIGPFKTRNNWGAAASPVLHQGRLYIVNDNDEQSFLAAYDARTGAGDLARGAQGGNQLVDTVRVAERAAHRDRDVRLRQGAVLRSVRKAAVGAVGDVDDLRFPHPSSASGCCTSARATSPTRCVPPTRSVPARPVTSRSKPGETSNAHIVWSSPTAAPYNPTPIVLRRHRTTRSSTAASSPATMRARGRRFIGVSASPARRADSPRRRGRTTARSSR